MRQSLLVRSGVSASAFVLLALGSCVKVSHRNRLQPMNAAPADTHATLLVVTQDPQSLTKQAKALGLTTNGDAVVAVSGPTELLKQLEVAPEDNATAAFNEAVTVDRGARRHTDSRTQGFDDSSEFGEDSTGETNYLAQEEFGLPAHQMQFPTHDGRGVKVGVVDDGISPFQSGFQKTSTGERKLIGKESHSTRLNIKLTESTVPAAAGFAQSIQEEAAKIWIGKVEETSPGGSGDGDFDLNVDNQMTTLAVAVLQKMDGSLRVCVDVNNSQAVDSGECFGTFAATGEFSFWNPAHTFALTAEFDPATAILKLTEGERPGDSHGEGVASVLAGHKIGGRFDGMAPGAQILDFDISASVTNPEESLYTIATFVQALDWLGKQGAEVCNISYSLFFHSAAGQQFMKQALDSLVKKYGFVISFSAGNNGPGVGSFNRGLIYPENALVAAAYVSKALDERVHGVTGLPDDGRIIWYSSVGPSADGGATPTVASPLASLTHSDPSAGFTAFSGTSSASPALGGFATVLISAAKQEGLKIKPDLVVNAIRMSGRALKGVPFVQQGAGVPQIDAALAWYRKLVNGEVFARIDASIDGNGTGPDGVKRTGILLRTSSQAGGDHPEYRIRLKGVVPSTVTQSGASEMLKAVKVTYSHPWIHGPERSFVSIGGSIISVTVDKPTLLTDGPRGSSHFGEVRLFDDTTGDLLKVVPVSVIDDFTLTSSLSFTRTLGAEEGTSVHLFVPAGVAGIKANLRLTSGDPTFAVVRVYDPYSIATATYRAPQMDNVWIPTPVPGWYQIGLVKYAGTEVPMTFEGSAEPISLSLASAGTSITGSGLKIANNGTLPVDARIRLKAAPERKSVMTTAGSNEYAVAKWPIEKTGSYSFSAEYLDRSDSSYPYPSCFINWTAADGTLKSKVAADKGVQVLSSGDIGGTLEYRCRGFEYSGLNSGTVTSENWRLTASRFDGYQQEGTLLGETVARIPVGLSNTPLNWLVPPTAGAEISVEVTQPTVSDRGSISLGAVQGF